MVGTRIGLAMTTALVALVVCSCARDDSASEVDPAGGSSSATGTETNGPGPDTPVDDPTLSLPALPIGGNLYSSIDGNRPTTSARTSTGSSTPLPLTWCPGSRSR